MTRFVPKSLPHALLCACRYVLRACPQSVAIQTLDRYSSWHQKPRPRLPGPQSLRRHAMATTRFVHTAAFTSILLLRRCLHGRKGWRWWFRLRLCLHLRMRRGSRWDGAVNLRLRLLCTLLRKLLHWHTAGLGICSLVRAGNQWRLWRKDLLLAEGGHRSRLSGTLVLLRDCAGAFRPWTAHTISSHLVCVRSIIGDALAKHLLRCSHLVRLIAGLAALMPVRSWAVLGRLSTVWRGEMLVIGRWQLLMWTRR